jgi:putative ABC transport system permease protein
MIKNYLITTIRVMLRQKGFTLINILGLTLGITCSFLIILWVIDEIKFDRVHHEAERIHRVLFNIKYPDGSINTWWNAPQPLEEVLETEYPEIEHAALIGWNSDRLLTIDEKNIKKPGVFASDDIFEVFDTPFISGDKLTSLKEKNSVVITDELAEILFGNDWSEKELIGTSILIEKEDLMMITGIVPKPSRNSSIQYNYVIPFEFGLDKQPWNREWGNYNNRMYVKLREGVDLNDLNKKIGDVVKTHREEGKGDATHAFLYPIKDLHLYGNFENGVSTGGRIEYINIFGVVSLIVLILACINFMNLATARSLSRAKEVGIRKVIGAGRQSLIFQFISESLIITFISILCAVLLTELLLPTFNLLTGKFLIIDFANPLYWIVGFAFLLFTGILAGFYPAFFISGFRPALVLKGKATTGEHTGFFRKSLVVFQFFLSIIMITGTIVIHRQINFIMTRNLGFDKENVLIYNLNQENYTQFQAIKTEALQYPEFVSITTCNQNPLNIGSSATGMQWEGKKEGEEIEFSHLWVTYDFIKTLGMDIAEGRDFSPELVSDSSSFLVNEAAVEAMGLEHPVGSKFGGFWIEDGKIIGVIKNFHSGSIYNPISPLIVLIDSEPYQMYMRTAEGKTMEAIQQLEKIHKKFSPSYPFEYSFMNEHYDRMYKSEVIMSKLANFFALLAIVISCLGLVGLASLTAAQRVKEIGIRKVLGATISDVLLLLSKDYARLILIALIISIPVANYFITGWLEKFQFRIDLSWWTYLIAGGIVLIIALLSVSSQSLKAAITNPVDSLRSE